MTSPPASAPPAVVEAAALDTVSMHFVPGVNHYSILLGKAGAEVVAAHVRAALPAA